MAAAEQHPQEGQPGSSAKQLASGHASELNACAGGTKNRGWAAVEGPSAVALAMATAPASGGRACEPATGREGAAGGALEGAGTAAMAAGKQTAEPAGRAAMAAGKAAEPAGRAKEAAGCSHKPAAFDARKRKVAQAVPTGAALTDPPQKKARLKGEAAASHRLEQMQQHQQDEDAAGVVALLHLESMRLQGQ